MTNYFFDPFGNFWLPVGGLIRRPKPCKQGFLGRPKSQELNGMKLKLVRPILTTIERFKNKTQNDAKWYHFKGKGFSVRYSPC